MDNEKKEALVLAGVTAAAGAYLALSPKVSSTPPSTTSSPSSSTPPSSTTTPPTTTTTSPPPPPTTTPTTTTPPSTTTTQYGSVTFVENGFYEYAVKGYRWTVTIDDQTKQGATEASFTLPFGTYTFKVTPPEGMTASPATGTVTISSTETVEVQIDFSGSPTSPPPSQPTTTLSSKSWLVASTTTNARVFFWEFSEPDYQTALQLSYKGPTETIDPQTNRIVWLADGNVYTGSRCIDQEGCAHMDAEVAYINAHFNESTLVGFYWQDCLWFLDVLYPGVTVEEALGSSHGPLTSVSSPDEIKLGLNFIGPTSALYGSFAEHPTQGWGTAFSGCSEEMVQAHTVTFVEKGLPPGTAWGVTLEGPFSAVQGTTATTGTSLQFIIPFAEKFTVSQAFNQYLRTPSPASGTVNPGETVEVTFS